MKRNKKTDKELYQFLSLAVDAINENEAGVSIVDSDGMRNFSQCYQELKALFNGSGAKVNCKPHDGFNSVGTISIIADSFAIQDTNAFTKAVKRAANYEIYPRTDGKLMMELIFYNLTRKVDGK